MATEFLPIALSLAILSTTNVAVHRDIFLINKSAQIRQEMSHHYRAAYYSPLLLDHNVFEQVTKKPISLAENDRHSPWPVIS